MKRSEIRFALFFHAQAKTKDQFFRFVTLQIFALCFASPATGFTELK
jgi:hypothetical protein